ncbi:MAG: tetratricopeptide repeat protein [Endomicrobiaceae bacterium]
MKKIIGLFLALVFAAACTQQVPVSDYKKGIEAAKNKQYDQAIAFFNTAVATEKDKDMVANALYNAGLCYGIKENYEEEISYYKKALEASDSCQPALYDLGMYYKKNGDNENSLKMFEKLTEVNPTHEGAFYMVGLIYGENGDKEKSEEYLKKAAELGSAEAQAAINQK